MTFILQKKKLKLIKIKWLSQVHKSDPDTGSSSHVWIWQLDYKESWAPKDWCFWTVMLEKTLDSPLNCTEIQPVHPKGNQSWIFIGRTDVEAETLILWPPDVENWLIWKDPDAGKDWRWRRRGNGDEKVGCHHRLNGHEFEQALGVGDGQGSLACCSRWCRLLRHTWVTELNWTELYICLYLSNVDFALLISLWHTSLHFHKYSFHHYLYVVWTFKIIVSCQFTNIFDEFQMVWKIIK